MTTHRWSFSFAATAVLILGAAGGARGQGSARPTSSTPLPLAVDLKKVTVGSWAEYRIADGQNNMTVRMALVARTDRAVDVETEIKGGPVAALGRTTMRVSIPIDNAGDEVKPKEQVIQLGNNPPMILPIETIGTRAQSFKKLDAKKRIGVDDIKVPGGTFPHADHYQDKGANGETIDFWISKSVPPFGLIKVTSSGAPGGSAVAMELTGHGGGAKPVITKTPQPFNAEAIMKQAQPAMSGGGTAAGSGAGPGPATGPPAPTIPSPHPGMPPTPAGSPAPRPPQKGPPPAGSTIPGSSHAAPIAPSAKDGPK